jgi:transposase-like protein
MSTETKCGCEGLWSNGFVGKKKRYKCKNCEYQFTKKKPKEYPHEMKLEAVKLLKEGVGIRGIGRLFC